MNEDEKKEKIVFALQTGLEKFKTQPIADLVDFVKTITPAKLKNFILTSYQNQADQERADGEEKILSAEADDVYISELSETL
ncbi:MAG: hypothetical protein JSW41_05365 [Candidatus Aenigmatarchaeota archaeon]|nr:MAG: hypothetical protein JSW41_05365 [Candidatus Aenigmarchaeota archaeon]